MLNKVSTINLTLLIAHQIDAAYWHEWEMFKLPGGIQFFVFLNILMFLVVVNLFVSVIQRRKSGIKCSIALAAISSLLLPIHLGFAFSGLNQFDLPLSIILIGATFLTASAQVIVTLRNKHEFLIGE